MPYVAIHPSGKIACRVLGPGDEERAKAAGYTLANVNWTAELVREYLPAVDVMRPDGGRTVAAVRGRREQFALVFYYSEAGEVSAQFAWDTIANCLNTNSALTM